MKIKQNPPIRYNTAIHNVCLLTEEKDEEHWMAGPD